MQDEDIYDIYEARLLLVIYLVKYCSGPIQVYES